MSADKTGPSLAPDQDSVIDRLALPLDAVVELHRHVNQLTATFGPAMTAVLRDLLTDADVRMAGAERGVRMEVGRLLNLRAETLGWYQGSEEAREQEVDCLAALMLELERRNRRSHSKPSKELVRARKLVDQYNQDHGA